MKFKCPRCKKILRRKDSKITRSLLTKTGKYKTTCLKYGKDVLCIPIKTKDS